MSDKDLLIERVDSVIPGGDLDARGMFEAIWGMPEQCSAAMLTRVHLPLDYQRVENVFITGMGASGIGAELVRALLAPRLEVPVVVNRGYDVPAYVDNRTLMLVVSYTGDTEETISACSAGLAHGAKVVIVTSGGALEQMARDSGLPLVCTFPRDLLPRAALAYLFFPIIAVLREAELTEGVEGEGELISMLKDKREEYAPGTESQKNRAKQLAADLYGRLPVIYGSDELSGVAALRWKAQLTETGKNLAYQNVFPELSHNEFAGLTYPKELLSQIHLVLLRDRQDHPRVLRQMEEAKAILSDGVAGISEVWAEGHAELVRVFSQIYLGDYVSLYLAILNGVDPSSSDRIDALWSTLEGTH